MIQIIRLLSVLHQISPELRGSIHSLLDQLALEAKKTETSADDQAVQALTAIASILGLY